MANELNELLAKIDSSNDRGERLSKLSDMELAELLVEEIWAYEDALSYKADIVNEAMARLAGVRYNEPIDWD